MELYGFAVALLFAIAIADLMVGVSNDAVNFLNSSVGSRVAPRHIIMIVASLGILAGVTFSSGMMEVARKGIFHPRFFVMPELITIFLAVMITDILLLDLFNTFGLPTSTTVSIVFELLGAAIAGLSFLVGGDPKLGFVVLFAMWGNLMVAGFAGSFVPTILNRFGVDPAVASSVFVHTFTDLIGFFLLLGLATVLLL